MNLDPHSLFTAENDRDWFPKQSSTSHQYLKEWMTCDKNISWMIDFYFQCQRPIINKRFKSHVRVIRTFGDIYVNSQQWNHMTVDMNTKTRRLYLYDETLCISLGSHTPNTVSCPLCYMNATTAIVVLLHVHVCSLCHMIIYCCTLHWYHIAIWFDLQKYGI